ncbi:UNVERIFIED_CONTAM: hypothetical protein FKN15_065335 [Acipenser sinensis]
MSSYETGRGVICPSPPREGGGGRGVGGCVGFTDHPEKHTDLYNGNFACQWHGMLGWY